MREVKILRVVSAKTLLPFILLFALYVQFHGDFGPGGGFQAGVIFGAGLILHALVFGLNESRRVIPEWVIESAAAVGVLIYGGVGVVAMLKGGKFLEYGVLDAHDRVHGQHTGLILIELGVGVTVSAVMLAIYGALAGRGRLST